MNRKNCISVSLAALAFIAVPAFGQNNAPGVPYDWSHHHVIFSPPSTQDQQTGVTADPRYWHQWIYRNLRHGAPDDQVSSNTQANSLLSPSPSLNTATPLGAARTRKSSGLWEMNMGSGATVGQGNYPAKFSFNTSTAYCSGAPQPDFTIYNTSIQGNSPETAQIVLGASRPAGGSSVQIGSVVYSFVNATSLITPAGSNACNIRSRSSAPADSTTQVATNLFNAITNGGSGGSSTWLCSSGSTPNTLLTAMQPGSSTTINLTAVTPGPTGFTFTQSGAANFTTFSSVAGSSSQATVIALDNLYSGCGTTRTGLHPSSSVSSGSTTITFAANVISTADIGSTITDTTSGHTTWIPANTKITAVVVNTATLSAATTGGTIATTDNLTITPPSGTVPNVYWSYNTSTSSSDTSTVSSSVSLSLDGSQLAFIHSPSSGTASLVLLKWHAGEGLPSGSAANIAGAAVTPTHQYAAGAASSYVSCPANTSCQLTLPFNNGNSVTNSSPYLNYNTGDLYVGDDKGVLHKFVNIFNGGVPSEVISGGWPLTVNLNQILTSPVLDIGTHNIYVADFSGRLSYVRDTGSTLGACAAGSPPCLGSTNQALGGPIVESPLIDSTTQRVFAFSGVTGAIVSYKLFQTDEALTTAQNKSITFTGASGRIYTSYPHVGAFDNIYFSSGPATGHLYFCAPDTSGSFFNAATLYQIGFNGTGVMNTSTNGSLIMMSASPASGTAADDCSPLTEFFTGTTDYLYAGVAINGSLSNCTGSATAGCLYNFTITSGTMPGNSTAGRNSQGGTSGITVDNTASPTAVGGSQVYFTPLSDSACTGVSGTGAPGNGTGGCATQAAQAALN